MIVELTELGGLRKRGILDREGEDNKAVRAI